jgi:membrane associated rhomboid family serine protease
MRRDSTFQFGLPRFDGAMRGIILVTLGIWVVIILAWAVDRPLAAAIIAFGQLNPAAFVHGAVWQLLTYPFIHLDPTHVLFALVGVYFIGGPVQERIRSRAFLELYLVSSIIAGGVGVLVAMSGRTPGPAYGAGCAADAILMVFYMMNRGTSIMLFPLPFQIPVLWVVVGIGGIEGAYFILSGFSFFYLVQLFGLGSGYLWYRFMWRRSIAGTMADQVVGFRNSYYRWKRRRAARKFEVYMRKHEHDPKQYFDEYGNFKPPDDRDKKDRGPGGWVN